MIRVFIFLIGVLALGAGLAWLADRPGEMILTWQGYEIRTSAMAAMLALLAITAALMFMWSLYRFILDGPRAVSDYFRSRRQVRGYEALSQGMIAIGAGDEALATQQARTARKLIANEPLVGLLTAQSAQLAGNPDKARDAFQDMLDDPKTELLGLHGLYVEARRAGDDTAAARLALQAVEKAPSLQWAAEAALKTYIGAGDWRAALSRLERNHHHRLLDRKTYRRHRAALLTGEAMHIEAEDPQAALSDAQEAHNLAPDLVPAAVIAGRILASDGKMGPASTILEKTWKAVPHPDIAEVYAHVRSGDSVRDRLKRVKMLANKNSTDPEARIAVANAAIEALDWPAARDALLPLIEGQPSQRVCLLMAEIEENERGDTGRVREWFARAIRAPRDPAWVADGQVSDHWAPASPVTGELDAYEWRVPDSVAPPEAAVLDWQPRPAGEADIPDAPLMIDVTDKAEETTKADDAAVPGDAEGPDEKAKDETIKTVEKDAIATNGVSLPVPESKTPKAPAASPAPEAQTMAVMPRAPDDPGIEEDESDEDTSRRKWLGAS